VLERHDSLYNGPLVAITTDGGTIQTTLYHPFWVLRGSDLHERPTPRELADHEDQGLSLQGRWVNSHELRAGDMLIGRDGSPQIVLHIAQQYEELYPVSNLTIEENHTFAVGPDAILVHNTAGCPRAPRGPLWTGTKSKTGVQNALGHFKKHGSEFPQYPNATQYAQGARNFVSNPPKGTLTKVRPNGDKLFYDPATNTFASQRADGALRTMFKPDPAKHGYPTNLDYFNAQ